MADKNRFISEKVLIHDDNATRRVRKNVTSIVANLPTAIAEQDLAKYGFAIGDYFNGASGYTYHLAHPDAYYGGYNSYATVSTRNVAIIVDTKANGAYESSGTVTTYLASTIYTLLSGTVLNNIKSDFIALFGGSTGLEHLVPHDIWCPTVASNAVAEGAWSSFNTRSVYIATPTESQVYGHSVYSAVAYKEVTCYKQLEIFQKFTYMEIFGNLWFWLRNLYSPTHACFAHSDGNAGYYTVTRTSGRVVGLILFH